MRKLIVRRPTRKGLVKKLDTVFSEYIRKRDGQCVQCGSIENLTCGHLITRSKYAVRWDERNAFGQCAGHNYSHEFNPHPFTVYFLNRFGAQAYKSLVRQSNSPRKLTDKELQQMIAEFENKLSESNNLADGKRKTIGNK